MDGTVFRDGTVLLRFGVVIAGGAVVVEVHVYAQFSGHQAVVVDVGAQVAHPLAGKRIVRDGSEFVYERSVQEHVVVHCGTDIVPQRLAPFQLAAEVVVIGNLPVHAGIAINAAPAVFVTEVTLVEQRMANAISVLSHIAHLQGGVAVVVHSGKYVHPARAVVHIECGGRVELERLFRNSFNLSPQSLREAHPGLTKGDIRIYILSQLRFSVSEQSVLLGISPSSVTKARQRLKAKLKKDKPLDLSSVVDYPFPLSNLVRGLEELLEIG